MVTTDRDQLLFAENIKNRDFAASELDRLALPKNERACLAALFRHLWIERDEKCRQAIEIPFAELIESSGLARTRLSATLGNLVRRNIVIKAGTGKICAYSIDWNVIYALRGDSEPVQPVRTGSGEPVQKLNRFSPTGSVSEPVHSKTEPVQPETEPVQTAVCTGSERPLDSFSVQERIANALEEIVLLVRELPEAIAQILNRFNPSARAGSKSEPVQPKSEPVQKRPAAPLKLNSIELNSINTNSIQFKGDPSDAGPDLNRWPNPHRKVLPDELRDDLKLDAIFDDVVKVAGWPPGDAGRRELFALAEYSLKAPSPVSAFIKAIKKKKFGPNRRAEQWAFEKADERLQTMLRTQRARDHPEAAAELESFVGGLQKPDLLELFKIAGLGESFEYQQFNRSSEAKLKGMNRDRVLKVLAGREIETIKLMLNQARRLRDSETVVPADETIS